VEQNSDAPDMSTQPRPAADEFDETGCWFIPLRSCANVPVPNNQSGRPPVVRFLLVIEMPNACDKRRVSLVSRPGDRLMLQLEVGKHVVGMILDGVIVDMTALRAPSSHSFSLGSRWTASAYS
jgi:hypothetical protein